MTGQEVVYVDTAGLEELAGEINHAVANAEAARFMVQDGVLKISVSRRSWSFGVGSNIEPGWHDEPEPVATSPVPPDCRCGHEYSDHWNWGTVWIGLPDGAEGCHGFDDKCGCLGYSATTDARSTT